MGGCSGKSQKSKEDQNPKIQEQAQNVEDAPQFVPKHRYKSNRNREQQSKNQSSNQNSRSPKSKPNTGKQKSSAQSQHESPRLQPEAQSQHQNQGPTLDKELKDEDDLQFQVSDQIAEHRNGQFSKYYTLADFIGKGSFGCVRKAQNNVTGIYRAVKIIKHSPGKGQAQLYQELNFLKSLDHPNIIKVYEFFQDKQFIYIVQEICEGGELFDRIAEIKQFGESSAAKIMSQILQALNYLHQRQIAHCDLKPENILLLQKEVNSPIKLIDFGISQKVVSQDNTYDKKGTLLYMAPEVFKKQGTLKSDIWSAGVILYFLLSGILPFKGKNDQQIQNAIKRGTVNFDGQEWVQVSKEGRGLVEKMLTYNPYNRPTAQKCLNDDWFIKYLNSAKDQTSLSQALGQMKEFRSTQKLQHATLMYVINLLATQEEKSKLMETFQQLDANKDGQLSKEELFQGYSTIMSPEEAKAEVNRIFSLIDDNKSQTIDYSEFLMVTVDRKQLLSKNKLDLAFKTLDKDGSGKLSLKEIRLLLGNARVPKEKWKLLIRDLDENGDGNISLKEFQKMMQSLIM